LVAKILWRLTHNEGLWRGTDDKKYTMSETDIFKGNNYLEGYGQVISFGWQVASVENRIR
jgi:hypothetical protein